ncbi:MAG TPA: glycosyltransferase family A protein [Puia sp.]|nr:glycosyltransferase family A protein [Puia sp.]
MGSPFFSIIIPTRNRYETLPYALITVLKQEFGSFELIVSDNSDEANLGGAGSIRSYLQDPRVKYVRPPSVLPMSDHWEFAVSQATGEYIIVFGDDDGLVEGSLGYIHDIFQKTAAQLVSWFRVEYSWPDRLPAGLANMMIIPHTVKTGLIDAEKYIKGIIAHKEDYRTLPMLYNSAVSRQLIQTLKDRTGRIFNAVSPDIYSGFAFAHLTKHYISVGRPLSINGVSAKSNGAAHANNSRNETRTDFWELLKKSEIRWPEELPEMITAYIGVVEPFIQLRRHFPELEAYITRKQIYRYIISRLSGDSEEEIAAFKQKLLESAGQDHDFRTWVEGQLRRAKPTIGPGPERPAGYADEIGFNGSRLLLDGSHFGLANVYDVSVFISHLFGNYKSVDFLRPVTTPLQERIRKAAGMILRPAHRDGRMWQ